MLRWTFAYPLSQLRQTQSKYPESTRHSFDGCVFDLGRTGAGAECSRAVKSIVAVGLRQLLRKVLEAERVYKQGRCVGGKESSSDSVCVDKQCSTQGGR